MPPKLSPTAALAHGPTRSALLATTLAGLAALLVALPAPHAAAGADKAPPSTPQNLRVLLATQTSLNLVWDPSTDDVAVEGYMVWFGQPTPRKPLDHQPSVRTREPQFTATQLACGQTYEVEVRAYDRANNVSEVLKSVVSTSPCVDNQPPTAPTSLQQIAASATSATLAWSPSTDNVAVAGYALSSAGIELGSTSETSYSFSGLSCGKTYAVAVRAYDVARNYSSWANYYVTTGACGDVSPPTAPTGLVQTNKTAAGMSVAWSPSSDNVGVARYEIFRDGALAGSTSSVSYSFSGLNCGTSYTAGVEGLDGAGNRSARTNATMSTAPCATPPPPTTDTQPPTTPTSLSLVAALPISMTLTWSPSTDNVGVTGYGMFHDGAPVQVVTGTTFVYQGLSCGTSHQLGVHAYDAKGNHSPIASVTASTSPCSDTSPPTTPRNPVLLDSTSSSATVLWSPSTDNVGVAGYGAYVDGRLAGSAVGQTYTFTGLACNKSFVLGIDAYDAAGNRSARVNVASTTTTCDDSQAPTTPSQLTVSNPTQTGLTLNWTASSDNGGVAGYDVFANGVKTATVTATGFTLSNLTCATAYQLGVEAFDAAGNRSGRPTVSGTTAQCSTPPPPSGSASVFLSPGGNDGGSCTQAAPCGSFNRAYTVAAPGATISVAAGSYGGQVLEWIPGRDSAAQVRFVPRGQVTISGNLEIAASGVYIDGAATGSMSDWRSRTFSFKVAGWTSVEGRSSTQYPRNVTLEGVDTSVLGTYSAQNVRVSDMDVGPSVVDAIGGRCSAPENKIGMNGVAAPVEPTNVVWERVAVHDQNRTLAAANLECHYGGLFVINGQGVTIRDSVFEQNVVYNIQMQNFVGNPASNVVIENNWFGCPVNNSFATNGANTCDGQTSLQFNAVSTFTNWVIRHNSFARGGAATGDGNRASFSNVVFVGNTGLAPSSDVCGKAGVTFARNAWVGQTCGSSDRSISNPFMSDLVGAEDLHLVAGSGAIDAGDPSNAPSADIDGQGRPMGSAPDAGADERS